MIYNLNTTKNKDFIKLGGHMIYNYKTELRYPVPEIVNEDNEIIKEETKETIKIMINKTNKKMKMIFALKRYVSNYDTPFYIYIQKL